MKPLRRSYFRAFVVVTLLAGSTLFWGTAVLAVGLFKFLLPTGKLRTRAVLLMARLADRWSRTNNGVIDRLLPTRFDIRGVSGLRKDGRYLIISNHCSWTDILILYRTLGERIPFLRFFMKRQLFWFPLIGLACWSFEFPFVRRYSPEYLARHPEKRAEDIRTTRRACRRFARIPISLLNFVEGTRFTPEKHAKQESPYRNLLIPRVGGIAHALSAAGPVVDQILDVTLAAPGSRLHIVDFVSGAIPLIVVDVRPMEVPQELTTESVTEPGASRNQLRSWIESIWSEKDALLEEIEGE